MYSVDRDLSNSLSAVKGGPLESGTYLVNDNGHINLRSQMYLPINKTSRTNM